MNVNIRTRCLQMLVPVLMPGGCSDPGTNAQCVETLRDPLAP